MLGLENYVLYVRIRKVWSGVFKQVRVSGVGQSDSQQNFPGRHSWSAGGGEASVRIRTTITFVCVWDLFVWLLYGLFISTKVCVYDLYLCGCCTVCSSVRIEGTTWRTSPTGLRIDATGTTKKNNHNPNNWLNDLHTRTQPINIHNTTLNTEPHKPHIHAHTITRTRASAHTYIHIRLHTATFVSFMFIVRILVLFDAHKLDISDEMKSVIQSLKGNHNKVLLNTQPNKQPIY